MSEPGNPVGDDGQAMRVRGAQGAMVLAARGAARALRRRGFRFALTSTLGRWLPRRTLRPRPSAWRPLLLRWARKAAAPGGGMGRAPASAAPASWYHWHFHFAAVPGSGRAPRAARAAAVTGPAQTQTPAQAQAPANWMNPARAGRIAATGERAFRGRAGRTESARLPPASSQPAGSGRPRPAASSASARWLRAEAASRRAQAISAPAAQSFGQPRAAGRHASAHFRPASTPVAARPPPGGFAAMRPIRRAPDAQAPAGAHGFLPQTYSGLTRELPWPARAQGVDDAFDAPRPPPAGRPQGEPAWRASGPAAPAAPAMRTGAAPGERAQARPGAFLRHARAQVTRTAPWPQWGQKAALAFDAPLPPALRRAPGEQAWRARGAAATAAPFPRQSAAARTVAGIAMGRPVDLVWPAVPASAAAPGATARFGSAPAAGSAAAPSMQAGAGVPAPSGRGGNDSVVRATALDPVLAARLADEVMRRIDHRARIERERRGL